MISVGVGGHFGFTKMPPNEMLHTLRNLRAKALIDSYQPSKKSVQHFQPPVHIHYIPPDYQACLHTHDFQISLKVHSTFVVVCVADCNQLMREPCCWLRQGSLINSVYVVRIWRYLVVTQYPRSHILVVTTKLNSLKEMLSPVVCHQ